MTDDWIREHVRSVFEQKRVGSEAAFHETELEAIIRSSFVRGQVEMALRCAQAAIIDANVFVPDDTLYKANVPLNDIVKTVRDQLHNLANEFSSWAIDSKLRSTRQTHPHKAGRTRRARNGKGPSPRSRRAGAR